MAVLDAAIDSARRARLVEALDAILSTPGYRRRLAHRFEAWTRAGRPAEAPPPGDSAVDVEEWAIFRAYRETLGRIEAEDSAGWAVWASIKVAKQPPPPLRKPGHVVVIEPIDLDPAGWRLLDWCHQQARSMTVILPFDADPALSEVYASADDARREFLRWGFEEQAERLEGFSFRPAALVAIERELFRSDAHQRPKLRFGPSQGLQILGAPRGEGAGLLIAREVASRLDRGIRPDEIQVVVPRLDEDAERIREVMQSWGLPIGPPPEGRLAKLPSVSALRLAMRLPVEGWEASSLVRLLRNGQIGPPDRGWFERFERFEAAAAIHSTRVFRDRRAIENALERGSRDGRPSRSEVVALRVLRRLGEIVDANVGEGPWPVQVARARRLAASLGLETEELAPLWDALEDQAWVRDRLGAEAKQRPLAWAEFVDQFEAIIAEVRVPDAGPRPGSIRIDAVRQAEGARSRVVILANLTEGTFPDVGAIDLDATTGVGNARPDLAYSREMLRFLRVAGSAEEGLILAYPTTDVNGEALLPAGFLDELIRRLDDETARSCVEHHSRFDPVLRAHEALARSDADARVRAVAVAMLGGGDDPLGMLAADPAHRDSLEGAASAFEVAHRRRVDREFGPYDGGLLDPRAIEAIRESFGADHAFSPSQLESFALCPFQFYQRYVLGLRMTDERQELDEDYAGRGSEIHEVLEEIHQQMVAEGAPDLIDRLPVLIATRVRVELEVGVSRPASVPAVLKEIGRLRTGKALSKYVVQFKAYVGDQTLGPTPHQFEVVFGQQDVEGDPRSLPHLTVGEDSGRVKLQGKIDRIDLVTDKVGRVGFRVIDYKTGSNPSGKDVISGLASQLPLYALAVEQLIFPGGEHDFVDLGYWSMPRDGFKTVKLPEWPTYRENLMNYVVRLVARLRDGHFPIDSQKKDCRKHCDYQAACRVAEVRLVGKTWAGRPNLGGE